jgi:poly(hydroxyalkanoate) depolymerase family esterase
MMTGKMFDMIYGATRLIVTTVVGASTAPIQRMFRTMAPIRSALRKVNPAGARKSSAQFLAGTYTNGVGTLDYKLFIPSGYRGRPLPLVVMLHGCKQDADDFAIGTRMNALAEERQCLVVYPTQTPRANSFRCWNWFKAVDQQRDQGEPSMIAGITRDVIQTFNVDRRRVYIAGLSAGGAMAVIMGTTYPELYAAVGVHSGLAYAGANDLYSAIVAMRSGARFILQHKDHDAAIIASARVMSTIVFHGDMDTTVHPDNGDLVLAQSASNMVDGALLQATDITVEQGQIPDGHAYTRTIHMDAAGQPVAEQWLVHGAGHAWSGGSPCGSFTDPKGPDATREMLRFLFTHSQEA